MENKINWFPGHMAKALKEINERKNLIDCFIIVIDSRVPLSSYNEEFDKIAPNKTRLFVFSKFDLSNQSRVREISKKFNNAHDYKTFVNLKSKKDVFKITKELNKILKTKQEKDKKRGLLNSKLKCFVVGMPNVGKSTLINLVSKNNKVKVANFPGTTKTLQWITNGNILLLDSPGIMMPKIENNKQGIKLLASNLIKKEILSDYLFVINAFDILKEINSSFFEKNEIEYFVEEEEKYSSIIKYGIKNKIVQKKGLIDEKRVFQILRKKIENLNNICWD